VARAPQPLAVVPGLARPRVGTTTSRSCSGTAAEGRGAGEERRWHGRPRFATRYAGSRPPSFELLAVATLCLRRSAWGRGTDASHAETVVHSHRHLAKHVVESRRAGPHDLVSDPDGHRDSWDAYGDSLNQGVLEYWIISLGR